MKKVEESRYTPKKYELFRKEAEWVDTNKTRRNQTTTRQTRSNHKDKRTKKREGTKILSVGKTVLIQYIESPSEQADKLPKLLENKTSGYEQTNIQKHLTI